MAGIWGDILLYGKIYGIRYMVYLVGRAYNIDNKQVSIILK